MDLIVGRFADAAIDAMSDAELDAFERLTEEPDGDLFAWIVGEAAAPAHLDATMLRRLRAFHGREPSTP